MEFHLAAIFVFVVTFVPYADVNDLMVYGSKYSKGFLPVGFSSGVSTRARMHGSKVDALPPS